jgi:hypothetical protein
MRYSGGDEDDRLFATGLGIGDGEDRDEVARHALA